MAYQYSPYDVFLNELAKWAAEQGQGKIMPVAFPSGPSAAIEYLKRSNIRFVQLVDPLSNLKAAGIDMPVIDLASGKFVYLPMDVNKAIQNANALVTGTKMTLITLQVGVSLIRMNVPGAAAVMAPQYNDADPNKAGYSPAQLVDIQNNIVRGLNYNPDYVRNAPIWPTILDTLAEMAEQIFDWPGPIDNPWDMQNMRVTPQIADPKNITMTKTPSGVFEFAMPQGGQLVPQSVRNDIPQWASAQYAVSILLKRGMPLLSILDFLLQNYPEFRPEAGWETAIPELMPLMGDQLERDSRGWTRTGAPPEIVWSCGGPTDFLSGPLIEGGVNVCPDGCAPPGVYAAPGLHPALMDPSLYLGAGHVFAYGPVTPSFDCGPESRPVMGRGKVIASPLPERIFWQGPVKTWSDPWNAPIGEPSSGSPIFGPTKNIPFPYRMPNERTVRGYGPHETPRTGGIRFIPGLPATPVDMETGFPKFPGMGLKVKKPSGSRAQTAAAMAMLNQITEFCDFVEALHDALPRKYQVVVPGKKLPGGKAQKVRGEISAGCAKMSSAVYTHFDKIQIASAFGNLAVNQIIDYIFGRGGQLAAKAGIALGHSRAAAISRLGAP